MHGGVGKNSMSEWFLKGYNLSFDCRDKFRKGLHELSEEHVDLVMGNHAGQNDTPGKLKKVLAGESIVDPTEWKKFLAYHEEQLDELIRKEKNKN